MDLIDRAGDLKGMLVDFGSSPRFRRELSAVIERNFPGGVITDEGQMTAVFDHFLLQHRLRSGTTVVEAFLDANPGLPAAEREMLRGWREVVESVFEVTGKDGRAALLVNLLDELTYRALSNMGGRAFRPLKKGMIVVGRLVPVGDDWMVSGHMTALPPASRTKVLALVAEQAFLHPEAVFRNPAKLAEARQIAAEHHAAFVELFGSDLIVVPGSEVTARVEEFDSHLAGQARPGAEQPVLPIADLPARILDDEGVAIYHAGDEGLGLFPSYHLLDELFRNPAQISRPRYRDVLSNYLRDPDTPPEPLRRLAARDPAKASAVLGKLLKSKRGFSWDTDGEELLRRYKPSYFDGTRLPVTAPLSKPLAEAYKKAH
jgi:hypothetical protein